jgi:hypothetical protein
MSHKNARQRFEVGDYLGSLQILEYFPPDGLGLYSRYKVKCKCGKEKILSNRLIGKSKSCGAVGCRVYPVKNLLPDSIAAKNVVLRTYKRHAQCRKLCWQLADDVAIGIFESNCHYCGVAPSNCATGARRRKTETGSKFYYSGIDRIDSSKGYEAGNVVPACRICNLAKTNLSLEDFLTWIERVYLFQLIKKN